jgi:hypothetical protein
LQWQFFDFIFIEMNKQKTLILNQLKIKQMK